MISLKTKLQYKYIYFIIIIFALIITFIRINTHESIYDETNKNFSMKIIKYKIDGNVLSLILDGKEKLKATYYIKTEKELEELVKNIKLGNVIEVRGELKQPLKNTIPNTFNYKEYLRSESIFYTLSIKKIIKIKNNNNLFYKFKNYVYSLISNKKNFDYIFSLVIGETNYLDESIYENYRINGVTHLFSVSGMHISLISLILFKMFSLIRIRERNKYILTSIILFIFSFLTGLTPPVVRSILFFILLGINKLLRLKIDNISLLLLTLSIILIINPFFILSLSLRFSFIISFFIIYFSVPNENYFKSLLRVSIVSFLASFPIIVNLNYEINLLTIVCNLIFVPFVSFIIFPLCLINILIPIDAITNFFINILEITNNFCVTKNLSIIFPKIEFIYIIIYYIFLLVYLYYKKRIIKILFVLLIIFMYISPLLNPNAYVYFLDVGNADSFLLVSKYRKKVIVIDTGGKLEFENKKDFEKRKKEYDKYKNVILFYKSLGITKIDYLFLTHSDYDHIGNLDKLLNNYKVKNIITNGSKNINVGEKINFKQKNINEFNIYNIETGLYDNENENSLILYFNIYNNLFLFMGDSSIRNELEILKTYNIKDIDVLKLGHHGSNTSSRYEFLKTMNPKYSIISVSKNNIYNHPSKSVIDSLNKLDLNYYLTSESGTVYYKINSKNMNIFTAIT